MQAHSRRAPAQEIQAQRRRFKKCPGPLDTVTASRHVKLPMKNTLTITQGQAQFPALCRKTKTTAITRNGEVVSFVVPRQKMADLLEQMEILANPEAMATINRAKQGGCGGAGNAE